MEKLFNPDDSKFYEVPDDKVEYVLSQGFRRASTEETVKDIGKSTIQGMGKGLIDGPFAAANLIALAETGIRKLFGNKDDNVVRPNEVTQPVKELLGLTKKAQTKEGEYASAITESIGGTITSGGFGGPGAALNKTQKLLTGLTAAAGGAGSQLGGDIATVASENPSMRMLGNVVGGLAAAAPVGILSTLITKMRAPRSAAAVQSRVEAITPEVFAAIENRRQMLNKAGSTSATMGDYTTPGINNLTQEVAGLQGAKVLLQKYTSRDDDIAKIMAKAVEGPEVNYQETLRKVFDNASETLNQPRKELNKVFAAELDANSITAETAQKLHTHFVQKAKASNKQAEAETYTRAAEALFNPTETGFITSARDITANLDYSKAKLVGDTTGGSTGTFVQKQAEKLVTEALKKEIPALNNYLTSYAKISAEVYEPMRTSAMKTLADKKYTPGNANEQVLQNAIATTDVKKMPEFIEGITSSSFMGPQTTKRDVAQILMEKVNKTSMRPGAQAAEGSLTRQHVATALDELQGTEKTAKYFNNIDAAHLLDKSSINAKGQKLLPDDLIPVGMSMRGPYVKPKDLKLSESETAKLSKLLADTGPDAMKNLKAFGDKNPAVKYYISTLQPALQSAGEK